MAFKLTLTDGDGLLLAQWEVAVGKSAPDTAWNLDSAMARFSLFDQIRFNIEQAEKFLSKGEDYEASE